MKNNVNNISYINWIRMECKAFWHGLTHPFQSHEQIIAWVEQESKKDMIRIFGKD
jgi:hypothetical protein